MPFLRRRSPSHELTRSEYVLAVDHRHRSALKWGARLLLVVIVIGVGVNYYESHLAPALFLSDVRAENRQLRDALDNARLDIEVEAATRSELERQVASLTEQLRKANEELVFLKSASRKPAGG